jgi:hypothetical protein
MRMPNNLSGIGQYKLSQGYHRNRNLKNKIVSSRSIACPLHVNAASIVRATPCAASTFDLIGAVCFQTREATIYCESTNIGWHISNQVITVYEKPP